LLELGLGQGGRTDAVEFTRWPWRHGLSLTAAAEVLGMSRRQIAYYASGEHDVPRYVLLACRGWEAERHAVASTTWKAGRLKLSNQPCEEFRLDRDEQCDRDAKGQTYNRAGDDAAPKHLLFAVFHFTFPIAIATLPLPHGKRPAPEATGGGALARARPDLNANQYPPYQKQRPRGSKAPLMRRCHFHEQGDSRVDGMLPEPLVPNRNLASEPHVSLQRNCNDGARLAGVGSSIII